MAKHYDKQFKIDAVQYYHDHRDLGPVSYTHLSPWCWNNRKIMNIVIKSVER